MPDHYDHRAELDASLTRLGRATDSLEPHPTLSESVMESIRGLATDRLPDTEGRRPEDVLETASRLTADLCPADDLGDEVMAAVSAVAPRSRLGRSLSAAGITRAGRAALLVAAAVAAVSVGYASYVEQRLDSDVMVAVDFVEASE